MKKKETSLGAKIGVAIIIIIGLSIVASMAAAVIMLFGGSTSDGNVAIIPVEGILLSGDGYARGVVTSDTLTDDLQVAADDDAIEAVILLINSPGGSAVASDEIAAAVEDMDKPVVAVIREVGASGAYWVASASDHVIANRMSVTGSIGVIGSYLSFGKFLEHWNVTYNQLTAGERKDVGTPFRELTSQEQAYLKKKLDAIHWFFKQAVMENRNLSEEAVDELAEGQWFLGYEALEAGLVDELGSMNEAEAWLNSTHDIQVEPVWYTHEPSIIDVLSSLKVNPLSSLDAGVSVPMAR
ncbi:signal peptide peptidase SppA [Candidatus Woesearchaeota archaeon]|nr:signal peptide peptidase SppA [Candidatus Woesearchaeota archaeon]